MQQKAVHNTVWYKLNVNIKYIKRKWYHVAEQKANKIPTTLREKFFKNKHECSFESTRLECLDQIQYKASTRPSVV